MPEDYRLYGTTMDDAVGEAFDKTAKLLGLPYPGGPNVEIRAARGNPRAYALPRPLLGAAAPGMDFSFSGLKTAVRQLAVQTQVNVDDACASFQAAVIDILQRSHGASAGAVPAGFSGYRRARPWWSRAASPPMPPSARR